VLGRTVGGTQLLDVNIAEALAGHERDLMRNGRSMCVTVLRTDLQRALLDAATVSPPPGAPVATLRAGAPVAGVDVAPDGRSATLRLADGSSTEGALLRAQSMRCAIRKNIAHAPPHFPSFSSHC
jgi:hypothetical protein